MGLGCGKLYVTIVRRLCFFFAVKIASQLFLRLTVKIVTAQINTAEQLCMPYPFIQVRVKCVYGNLTRRIPNRRNVRITLLQSSQIHLLFLLSCSRHFPFAITNKKYLLDSLINGNITRFLCEHRTPHSTVGPLQWRAATGNSDSRAPTTDTGHKLILITIIIIIIIIIKIIMLYYNVDKRNN